MLFTGISCTGNTGPSKKFVDKLIAIIDDFLKVRLITPERGSLNICKLVKCGLSRCPATTLAFQCFHETKVSFFTA